MRLTLSLIVFCAFLSACSKDTPPTNGPCEPIITQNHSNDTVFPSEYLMAYPGSWWEYNTGLIDSCESWEYVPIRSTTSGAQGCLYVQEDMWILPEGLLYADHIAFDQKVISPEDLTSTRSSPMLDTTVGIFHQNQYTTGSGEYTCNVSDTRETLDRLDSMVIGTNTYYDVLYVRHAESWYYPAAPGGPSFAKYFWFAKNVGLIKWIREENNWPYEELELVNHHIAPH